MSLKYYEISPIISERAAVFPGDCSFKRNIMLDLKKGNNLTLSSIETTLHIGAHADAPNHYHRDGVDIAQRALDYYYGPCQLIKVNSQRGERISVADLKQKEIQAERVLLCSNSFPDPDMWTDQFCSLSVELINYFAQKKVKLIGIDTPSIDPADSKDLPAHHAIYNNNMAILEGLVLDHVPEGIYQLIALPLRLEGADASPVRAILIK